MDYHQKELENLKFSHRYRYELYRDQDAQIMLITPMVLLHLILPTSTAASKSSMWNTVKCGCASTIPSIF